MFWAKLSMVILDSVSVGKCGFLSFELRWAGLYKVNPQPPYNDAARTQKKNRGSFYFSIVTI